ncbi:MAG TPA: hypothetical protein VEH50_04535 [Methylomirabilota bacterium]|nr:hypothetical protein [Methylomirabilota bacterium]
MRFPAEVCIPGRARCRIADALRRLLPLSPLLIGLVLVSGCGGGGGGSAPPTPANPSLSAIVSNIASVYPNATNATYSITVSNAVGSAATSGTVTVTDPPTNLTVTAISGPSWTCILATLTCTRSDPLSGGSSYSIITVVGTVTGTAGQAISIPITIAGGGQTSTSNSPGSITIEPPYTIGGTISGLTGTGLVLQNNGGNKLTVSAGATSFTFSLPVSGGSTYSVTVLTQPSNPTENCVVASGSGTANANVTNIQITCTIVTYTIGGVVSGLTGAGLVLQDNGDDNLSVTANGQFTFATALHSGATYDVTVLTQPSNPAQICVVANGSGTANANVTTVVVTCPAASTVNFGTTYQTIRGFGGATAWLGPLTTAQATALFNPPNGLGLSILRVRIDPEGSPTTTPPYYTSEWADELTNATEAQSANSHAIVFASPWTPPPSMKTSSASQPYYSGSAACSPGPGYCGGYLNPTSYAAYGSYLEDFVTYFANNGVSLYAISMQNEPDSSAGSTQNYETCSWTPQQMDTWVANSSSVLTTRLMMPESAFFETSQSDPTLDDANAVGHVSIIAGHLYGNPVTAPFYYTNAETNGKEVWETEHTLSPAGAQPAIGDALALAQEIHNSMTVGYYNAYVWWWIWDRPDYGNNSGLINSSTSTPAPTYYGYAIGQFSKFIQPGAVRVSATNSAAGVYVSAYMQGSTGIIVAINANTSPASVPMAFTLQNFSASTATPYVTSSQGGLIQQGAVNVSDGSFAYSLPAQSVTTFVVTP